MPSACKRRSASNTRPAASGDGTRCSQTSPAIATTSTRSSTAIATTSSIAAANSSERERPRIAFPTCQSAVWSSRKRYSVPLERAERIGARVARGLVGARRPRREREAHLDRDRDVGLLKDHRPRLQDRGARARDRREEPVLPALGLRRVEPPDDAERGVRDHAPLHLARGLLRADQDHAEGAAALR